MRWAALAVEVPAHAENLSEILAQHSHSDIGDYATVAECLAACEAFIDRWLGGRIRQVACACTDIELQSDPPPEPAPDPTRCPNCARDPDPRGWTACHDCRTLNGMA